MKLTYRGVQYQEKCLKISALVLVNNQNKEIIYRGNSTKARINPRFPLTKYIKQLLSKSESRPVLDPITFWYNHKREFIEQCWHLKDIGKLDRAWNLTVQIEAVKTLKSKQKIKLKYRGVTYYR